MKGYLTDLEEKKSRFNKSPIITVNERPHNYGEYEALSSNGWRVPFRGEVSGNDSADAILEKTIWISDQTLPEDETGLNKGQMYGHGTVGVVDSVAVIRGKGKLGKTHALHAVTTSSLLGYEEYGSLISAGYRNSGFGTQPPPTAYVDQDPSTRLVKPVAL